MCLPPISPAYGKKQGEQSPQCRQKALYILKSPSTEPSQFINVPVYSGLTAISSVLTAPHCEQLYMIWPGVISVGSPSALAGSLSYACPTTGKMSGVSVGKCGMQTARFFCSHCGDFSSFPHFFCWKASTRLDCRKGVTPIAENLNNPHFRLPFLFRLFDLS